LDISIEEGLVLDGKDAVRATLNMLAPDGTGIYRYYLNLNRKGEGVYQKSSCPGVLSSCSVPLNQTTPYRIDIWIVRMSFDEACVTFEKLDSDYSRTLSKHEECVDTPEFLY